MTEFVSAQLLDTEPTIEVRRPRPDAALVVLGGEHDLQSAPLVEQAGAEALLTCSHLIVDLSPVLFIDSSACFHYGSRNAVRPRFQFMYTLTTPCRCDLFQTQFEARYPVPDDASALRRMVTEPWRRKPR